MARLKHLDEAADFEGFLCIISVVGVPATNRAIGPRRSRLPLPLHSRHHRKSKAQGNSLGHYRGKP